MSNPQAFEAVVVDPAGKVLLRTVAAASIDSARQLASADGHTILRCTAKEFQTRRLMFPWTHRLPKRTPIDIVAFAQDAATILEAGVSVKEAMRALAARESSPSRAQVFKDIEAALGQGLSLSRALEQLNVFPALLTATIAASEQTGDLATGLARFARHQISLRVVRDRVIGASVYPLLLLAIGSLVIAILLGVVVPRFATLIDTSSAGRELPLLSSMLMGWGQFVVTNPLVPIIGAALLLAAMGVVFSQWRRTEVRKALLQRIPGVARIVREFQHLQMYRTAAILTARGITIHKALVYCLELLGPQDRTRLQESVDEMTQGVTISQALSNSGLSDVVATSMLSVAERTGAMPEMLDRIADFYERTLQRNIEIVSRLIEPVLMIVFGIIIGGIVILMYLPIFDLASSIG